MTELIPLDKKKKRVCVDHSYAFPLYLSEIRKYKIEEGEELSEETFEQIRDVLTSRLKERVLFYITDADKSEHEIMLKMTRAGYPEDIVHKVVDQLKEYHYIDDERYARTYAESLLVFHNKSRGYVTNKLYEKGINKELIEEVLSEFEVDETSLILEQLRKKGFDSDRLKSLDAKEKQKLYASFLRKGFRSKDIGNALHCDSFYE